MVDKKSWQKGDAHINHFRRVALGIGAVFGGRILGKALIGFNSQIEEGKNQIAGMLAFGKNSVGIQTTMNAELANANILYDNLQKKAMELPGETQDYVNMLGMIAQPLSAAGASLAQMEDFTVNAFVLSKGLGESWQKSARDIREFVNYGKINMVDTFTRTVMKSQGYDADEKSRQKLRKMTPAQRKDLMDAGINSPVVKEMIAAQAASFQGRLDAVKGNLKLIMGQVGASLFASLKDTMTKIADWLERNRATIKAWAETVGSAIGRAFEALQSGISWLLDHEDILYALLAGISIALILMAGSAMIAWMAVAWPMFLGAGLFLMFTKVARALGPIGFALLTVGAMAALMWLGIGGPVVWAIVALAAMGAAVYVWRDDLLKTFEEVKDAAGKVFKVLSYIPGVSNIIGIGELAYGAATGDKAMMAKGAAQAVFGPGGAAATDLIDGGAYLARKATRGGDSGPARNDLPADQFGKQVNVNVGPTTLNITTNDAAGAKKAFDTTRKDQMDQAARNAMDNLK